VEYPSAPICFAPSFPLCWRMAKQMGRDGRS
jgi:hypothetical protein